MEPASGFLLGADSIHYRTLRIVQCPRDPNREDQPSVLRVGPFEQPRKRADEKTLLCLDRGVAFVVEPAVQFVNASRALHVNPVEIDIDLPAEDLLPIQVQVSTEGRKRGHWQRDRARIAEANHLRHALVPRQAGEFAFSDVEVARPMDSRQGIG